MTDDTTADESNSEPNETTGVAAGVPAALTRRSDPLASVDPRDGPTAMVPVGEAVADARVVGLGEATHGSRELFAAKAALLRHLVENRGLRAIAWEANYPESRAIDRYVRRGEGDPRSALEGLGLWPWNTETVVELLEWIRSFNADRPPADRVRFFGFDAQHTPEAARTILDVLDAVEAKGGPTIADPESVREDLSGLLDPGVDAYDPDGRGDRIATARRVTLALREWLRRPAVRGKFPLFAGADRIDLADAHQHVTVLEQATALAAACEDAEDGFSEEVIRVREVATARNVAWLLECEDLDRIALWAHNAHVNRSFEQAAEYTSTSMGGYLADWYGDDYYALGLEFARGGFTAIGPSSAGVDDEADDSSDEGADDQRDDDRERELREWVLDEPLAGVGEAFERSDHDLAFLDFEAAHEDPRLADWLDGERGTHRIGATYDPDDDPIEYVRTFDLGEAFDGVLYVEETTGTRHPKKE